MVCFLCNYIDTDSIDGGKMIKQYQHHIISFLFLFSACSISLHDYYNKKINAQPIQKEIISENVVINDDVKDIQASKVVFVKEKETVKTILQNNGLNECELEKVLKSLKAQLGQFQLNKGQEVNIEVIDGTLKRMSFRLLSQYEINVTLQDQKYITEKKEIALTKKLKFITGTIDGNFHKAAKKSGLPAKLVKTASVNLGYLINFQHELKKGDTYQFVYESMVDDQGKEVKSGNILYLRMETKSKEYVLYGYPKEDGKHIDYYTKQGEGVVRGLLQTPLDGRRVRITSGFTLKGRHHPILGFCRAHKGVDFGATYGTPIIAAGDGVVTQAGYDGDYGNKITITHQGGYKTVYAHLSKIKIKKGAFVKQRQVIGNVGTTGLSSGPHLHFETIANNVHVNPMSVKQLPAVKLTGSEFKKFQNHVFSIEKKVKELNPPTVTVESKC